MTSGQGVHDQVLVERWNAVVHPDDTVFVLGDVMLKYSSEDDVSKAE